MIEQIVEHRFIINCDKCPNYEYIDAISWNAMIKEVKRLDWKIVPKLDGFDHICPICGGG